jgi:hypothetical protein
MLTDQSAPVKDSGSTSKPLLTRQGRGFEGEVVAAVYLRWWRRIAGAMALDGTIGVHARFSARRAAGCLKRSMLWRSRQRPKRGAFRRKGAAARGVAKAVRRLAIARVPVAGHADRP